LLIGPNDLAVSLGVPGELLGTVVHDAIGKVRAAAAKHGIAFGMHAGDELLRQWKDQDMKIIMNNMDIHFIFDGLHKIAETYK